MAEAGVIKAVLFDKDGTLFQFEATWGEWVQRVVKSLAPHDGDLQIRLGKLVGYDVKASSFDADSIVIAASGDEVIARWCAELSDTPESTVRAVCAEHEESLPLVSCCDLPTMVHALHAQGLRLGIATNDYERVAVAHLAEASLTDAFDCVLGSDSGFGAKPAPGMLNAFCEQTGVQTREAVMVGDSTRDLEAARNAGFGLAVGVLTGPAQADELSPLADVVLDSVEALPDFLMRFTRSL